MAALEGVELLAKVKELPKASKSELVRACGYVSVKKNGSDRLNFTGFYEALLEAKGVALGTAASSNGHSKAGRKLSYTAMVQFNGNLLVGKAYTALLGLQPGEEFTITLNPRKKSVRLSPVGGEPDEGDADGESEGGVPGAVDGDTIQTATLSQKDLALAAA